MFVQPSDVVAHLALKDGATVVDLGSGSGAFAIAAARAMHGTGRVYAVDVQQGLLGRIQIAARAAGLGNVGVVWGDIERRGGVKLSDGTADAVIIANTLFQAEDRPGTLREAARLLAPGGKILVVDWTASFAGLGPHADQVVPEQAARKLLEDGGFGDVQPAPAGDQHYGLIATLRA